MFCALLNSTLRSSNGNLSCDHATAYLRLGTLSSADGGCHVLLDFAYVFHELLRMLEHSWSKQGQCQNNASADATQTRKFASAFQHIPACP